MCCSCRTGLTGGQVGKAEASRKVIIIRTAARAFIYLNNTYYYTSTAVGVGCSNGSVLLNVVLSIRWAGTCTQYLLLFLHDEKESRSETRTYYLKRNTTLPSFFVCFDFSLNLPWISRCLCTDIIQIQYHNIQNLPAYFTSAADIDIVVASFVFTRRRVTK